MNERPSASVLFLLNSLETGGSEAKTIRLANTLAGRGLRVTLAYLGLPDTLRDAIFPQVAPVHLRRRGKLSLRALRLLARTIRDREVGTVVSVNLYASLYAALARLRPGGPRWRFVAAMNTTRIETRKLALQMHLYRPVLRTADLLIFGAETQRRLWSEEHGIGANATRTRVIYNGVDASRFAPAPQSAHRVDCGLRTRFIIGTVGQMRPEKSQLDLVRATFHLRARGIDVGALLVGDGQERERIEAEIARLGLRGAVVLAGERRDVRPSLCSMDLFVLPSNATETFSNAALEALACGVPVVASRVGGIPELLAHGGGITYPPGDVTALTEQVAELLRNPARRLALAAEARRAALEHFDWECMVQQYLAALLPGNGAAGCATVAGPRHQPRETA